MINIDELIRRAIKSRDKHLDLYREMKTAFVKYEKDTKSNIDEVSQLNIINGLIKLRAKAIEVMDKEHPLVYKYGSEMLELDKFIPKRNIEEENLYINEIIDGYTTNDLSMSLMRDILNKVKSKYPLVEAKTVASILKSRLN